MRIRESNVTMSGAVRRVLGLATFVFVGAGFVFDRSPPLFVAAGVFATMWWAWDFLVDYVFEPIEAFAHHLLQGGAAQGDPSIPRPTLDDTVRLLENHLANPTSAKVDINAAIRLEEIYRTVKKDSDKARAVIRTVRERYPEAPELERFRSSDDGLAGLENL
jgi:hypothetical protein